MARKHKDFWNWHHIQYYKMRDYLDIFPYILISFSCGFISFGWLHTTFSLFFLPKFNLLTGYFKLIDQKLYLLYNLNDWHSLRFLIHRDTYTLIIGCISFEYERT